MTGRAAWDSSQEVLLRNGKPGVWPGYIRQLFTLLAIRMSLHTASGQSQLYHSHNTDALIYTVLDENVEEFLKCLLHCPKIVVIDYKLATAAF